MLYQYRRRRNNRTRAWVVAVACTTSVSLTTSLSPAVAQEGSSASSLVATISDAQAEIDRLNLEMGALREAVNKAIVDFGDAESAAEQARQGARDARESLNKSQSAVETAQGELDDVSRSTYRNGGSGNSIAPLDSGDAVKNSLDRGSFLSKQRDEKQGTLDRLEGERTANANADSLLRLAVQLAEDREEDAETAEQAANELLEDNQEALTEKSEELTSAEEDLRSAQEALEEIRPGSVGTPEHSPAPEVRPDGTSVTEPVAPSATTEADVESAPEPSAAKPTSASEEPGASTEGSVAPAAEPEADTGNAENIESTETPSEAGAEFGEDSAPQVQNQYYNDSRSVTDGDAASELSSQAVSAISRLATDKADESILDREIPVPTLEQIQDAVRTVKSTQGSFDESKQDDLAAVAAVVAATLVVLSSQVSNLDLAQGSSVIGAAIGQTAGTDSTNSTGTTTTESTTEESTTDSAPEAGDAETSLSSLPAITAELETETAELDGVLPEVQTVEQVSNNASEIVADSSRAAKIETVIARAESQLGVPYAWGGGDANGPTRGIRDGGVADAHGDYNKVGFDCSGLTLYAFAGVGISLPHYTGYQYQRGTKISPSEAQRGDLLFWGPQGNHHVAIYLGDGMMIEAPQSGSVVKKSPVRWSSMSQYAVRLI